MSGFSCRFSAFDVAAGSSSAAREQDGVARAGRQRRGRHRELGALAARDDHVVRRLARRDRVEAVDRGGELVRVVAVDRRRSCSRRARAGVGRSGSPGRPSSGRSPSGRAARACPRTPRAARRRRTAGSARRSALPAKTDAATPPCQLSLSTSTTAFGRVVSLVAGPDRARDARDVGDRVAAAHAGRVLRGVKGKPSSAAASSSSAFTPIWGGRVVVVVPMRTARKERRRQASRSDRADEPPRLTLARAVSAAGQRYD